MNLRTATAALVGGVLLGCAAISGAAWGQTAACWGEVSAARSVTSASLNDDFAGPATLGLSGMAGGLAFGCDLSLAGQDLLGVPVVGLFGRYDLADIKSRLGAAELSSDASWQIAARAGIRINPGTLVYGLAGVAGTELSFAGLESDPQGILYGAGLEIDLAVKNLALSFEWNHIDWRREREGTMSLVPETDTFRVGLKLKVDILK